MTDKFEQFLSYEMRDGLHYWPYTEGLYPLLKGESIISREEAIEAIGLSRVEDLENQLKFKRDPTVEMVTITEAEYKQLKRDARLLAHLKAAGVDNWEGYSHPDVDED